jgi:Tfp pilus assembly protein PilV
MRALGHNSARRIKDQVGATLIEVMVAGLVFMIGLMGGMTLVITAIANNNRSKMDSTATLIAQKTMEKIASIPADAIATSTPSSTVSITDCNPDSTQATHSINALGSSTGEGAPLAGSNINFGATKVSGYWMTYYACQTSTGDRQGSYDVRWWVKNLTTSGGTTQSKLVIVSAERLGTQTGHANSYIKPVSLKMIVGL